MHLRSRYKYVLFRHLAERGTIVVGEVPHGVVERETSLVGALAILVVADLVDSEEEVDEVAGHPELLIAGVRVSVCAEQLAAALEEECTLLVREDTVRVDPL